MGKAKKAFEDGEDWMKNPEEKIAEAKAVLGKIGQVKNWLFKKNQKVLLHLE